MVSCLEQGANCLQVMPLLPQTPSSLASFEIQTGFTFLVPTYPGCPGKEAVKRV